MGQKNNCQAKANAPLINESAESKQIEADLQRSEARYRAIVEDQTELICRFLRDGTLTFVNGAYCRYFGKSEECLMGQNIFQLIPEGDREMLGEHLASLGPENPVSMIEHRVITPGEEIRWQQWTTRVLLDEHGHVVEYQAVGRDITARKEEEEHERLLQSLEIERARAASLFQQSPAFVAVLRGPGHVFELANPQYLRLVGYRDVIGKTVQEALPEIEGQGYFQLLDNVFQTGEPHVGKESRVMLRRERGGHLEARFLDFVYQPIFDADRSVSGVFVQGVDITERKLAENKLREQKETLQKIFDHIPALISFFDEDNRPKLVNRELERTLGWTVEEIKARNLDVLAECYPDPHDRQKAREFIDAANGEWADFKIRVKDGRMIDTTWANVRLSDGTRVGIGQDITERKRAEEKLRQSERQLAEAQHMAHIGSWNWDLRSSTVTWSDELYRIFGVNQQAFNPAYEDEIMEAIHPGDRALVRSTVESSLQTKEPWSFYYRILRPDGEERVIHSRGEIVSDGHGNPIRLFGTAQDVTERRRAEEALKESQRRLEEAQRIAHVGHWERDLRTGVITWSDEIYRIFGLERQVSPPTEWQHMLHPEDRERISLAIEESQRGIARYDVEYRIVRPDGEVRFLHSQGDIIRDEHGELCRAFGIAQDITERRRVEEERVRLVGEVINVQEAERRRIAQDLHDQLKGDLAALNWEVDSIRQHVTGVLQSHPSGGLAALRELLDSQGQLKELERLCNQLVEAVDDIVWTLRPPELEDPFPIVLKDFLERWSGRYKIQTKFASMCPDDLRLKPQIERELYRIVQEGLTNIRKHAQAGHVTLGLDCDEERARIYLKDDGKGFDVQAVKNDSSKDRGLGLRGMEERIALLGGRMYITSAPHKGTEVVVDVPLRLKDRSVDYR